MEIVDMEDIYIGQLKYIESWLHKKERKGFEEYWVVLKNCYMFFFKDQNTHVKEQYVGYIEITDSSKCVKGKSAKDGKCEFSLTTGKKKFGLKAQHDILRERWMHAIDLVAKKEPPGPLPGDVDFQSEINNNSSQQPYRKKVERSNTLPLPQQSEEKPKMKSTMKRAKSVQLPTSEFLCSISEISFEEEPDEDSQEDYEEVFLPPSWYFKGQTRPEAESLLSSKPIGTFLLRDTGTGKKMLCFTLSFRDEEKIKHHKIQPQDGGYAFYGAETHVFKSPTDAAMSLMHSKHSHLNPKELVSESFERTAGDGDEFPSAFEEGYPEECVRRPSSTSSISPVSPLTPSDQSSRCPVDGPFATAAPTVPSRKSSMKGRPLPNVPGAENYVNASAIVMAAMEKTRQLEEISDQGAYVNLRPDPPPPIPKKRSSIKKSPQPLYQNLPPSAPYRTGNPTLSPTQGRRMNPSK